jgi:DNA repair exonuclease SbcCD nuclease subunit
MATILHVADLHLDRAFQGQSFAGCDGARRRQLLRQALEWAVDLAIERHPDLLTVGGDLFENEHVTSDTVAFITRQLTRVPGPVLVVSGNHDCSSPASPYHTTQWPANVTLRLEPALLPLDLNGAVVWSLGYSRPDIDARALQGFQVPADERAHILVAHGVDTSASTAEAGRLNLSPDIVQRLGFQHVLLGHIHAGRIAGIMSNPGAPVPLDPGDVTGNHGALWITTEGKAVSIEPVPLELARFVTLDVDVSAIADSSALETALQKETRALPRAASALVTCRLRGRRPDTLLIEVDRLATALAAGVMGASVVDASDPEIDLGEMAREGNARGKAIAQLLADGSDGARLAARLVVEAFEQDLRLPV